MHVRIWEEDAALNVRTIFILSSTWDFSKYICFLLEVECFEDRMTNQWNRDFASSPILYRNVRTFQRTILSAQNFYMKTVMAESCWQAKARSFQRWCNCELHIPQLENNKKWSIRLDINRITSERWDKEETAALNVRVCTTFTDIFTCHFIWRPATSRKTGWRNAVDEINISLRLLRTIATFVRLQRWRKIVMAESSQAELAVVVCSNIPRKYSKIILNQKFISERLPAVIHHSVTSPHGCLLELPRRIRSTIPSRSWALDSMCCLPFNIEVLDYCLRLCHLLTTSRSPFGRKYTFPVCAFLSSSSLSCTRSRTSWDIGDNIGRSISTSRNKEFFEHWLGPPTASLIWWNLIDFHSAPNQTIVKRFQVGRCSKSLRSRIPTWTLLVSSQIDLNVFHCTGTFSLRT